jgi:hypothetical protein
MIPGPGARPRAPRLGLVVLLPLLLGGLGLPRAAAAQPVGIEVRMVLASNDPRGGTDPGLGPIASQLRQALAYSSYRLLSAQAGAVAADRPWRIAVPGGRSLEITAPSAQGPGIALVVRMLAGGTPLVHTTVRLARGGPPVLVGGPPFESGVLLIAISAR